MKRLIRKILLWLGLFLTGCGPVVPQLGMWVTYPPYWPCAILRVDGQRYDVVKEHMQLFVDTVSAPRGLTGPITLHLRRLPDEQCLWLIGASKGGIPIWELPQ